MSEPKVTKYAVIGGGILGISLARQILLSAPNSSVTVFEKESTLAAHQTGHNSGVIHAGLYYTPNSLKATLCQHGARLLEKFAIEHNVPFEHSGKLVIASAEDELAQLQNIYVRSLQNNVPEVKKLEADEIQDIEPFAHGVGAVHSPKTGIIDYTELTNALAKDFTQRGGVIKLNCAVTALVQNNGGVTVKTASEELHVDRVIACTGLQSDRLARASGAEVYPKIIPFSGDYYLLAEERSHLVHGMIYPVPNPKFPFLGVHLTKTMSGQVTVGPNAFLAFDREGYKRTSFRLKDSLATALAPAFWKFALKNPGTIYNQLFESSQAAFAKGASNFVPGIEKTDLSVGPRGIRAQAMDAKGRLLDDFAIDVQDNVLHIRNAPSPAATASLAIAEYIVKKYLQN